MSFFSETFLLQFPITVILLCIHDKSSVGWTEFPVLTQKRHCGMSGIAPALLQSKLLWADSIFAYKRGFNVDLVSRDHFKRKLSRTENKSC